MVPTMVRRDSRTRGGEEAYHDSSSGNNNDDDADDDSKPNQRRVNGCGRKDYLEGRLYGCDEPSKTAKFASTDDDNRNETIVLNEEDYARYLRNDTPHVRQNLAQWNAVYKRYGAEVCAAERSRMFGQKALRGASISDIPTIVRHGRYTACVNVKLPNVTDESATNFHVCNFLPLVIGTNVDLLQRRVVDGPNERTRYGEIYMFNMFWVFNSFLCTDSKLFHEYRSHRRTVDEVENNRVAGVDKTDSCIRAYIYDQKGKGHMLFTRNDRELWLRDCHKREVRLIDKNGGTDASADGNEIVRSFVDNVLLLHPSFIDFPRDSSLVFRDVRDYMLHGVAATTAAPTEENGQFGDWYRHIDDLENKRIASAPALYVGILEAMSRTLADILTSHHTNATIVVSERCGGVECFDERSFIRAVESCVVKYTAAAHRADLKPYISRKTVIRVDWSDFMKRQVKMDLRKNKRTASIIAIDASGVGVGVGVGVGAGAGMVGSSSIGVSIGGGSDVLRIEATSPTMRSMKINVRAPDISQSRNQTQQQFLCSKIHENTEYDYEQVKRMRVVNINSTKNLGLPERSERFFSPCNTGSINKAGRIINRTHTLRESFFVDLNESIRRVTVATRRYFVEHIVAENDNATTTTDHVIDNDGGESFTILAVNEIPIALLRFRMHHVRDFRADDASAFWRFFRDIKRFEPMCCVNMAILRGSCTFASMLLNVRVANGIPMTPVSLDATETTTVSPTVVEERSVAAMFCAACGEFKPTKVSAKFLLNVSGTSPLTRYDTCSRHVWCTRRELDLYEQTSGARLDDPLYHEMACHGSLIVSAYQPVTDISKMIVSINAYKRSLNTVDEIDNVDEVKRVLTNSDTNGRRTWLRVKRMRRYHPYVRASTSCPTDANVDSTTGIKVEDGSGSYREKDSPISSYIAERRMLRLFFAFGDFNMMNCEDGYVLDRHVPFRVDSVVCCRFSLTTTVPDERISFLSRMRLEYPLDRGLCLHIGTFRSWSPINFSSNNALLVYRRHRSAQRDVEPFEYDAYYRLNASFVQIPAPTGTTSSCLFRTLQRSHTPSRVSGDRERDDVILSERYVYEQRCRRCRDRSNDGELCQPVSQAVLEIHEKIIRLKLHLSDTKQTIKLQNSFGQKGVAQFADLSDLVTEHGEPVHVIASMFSLIGRNACGQLMEQQSSLARVYSRSSGRELGYGGYGYFFVSDDSPHNNFIYSIRREGDNPIRMCRLTYECLLENNVSSAAFSKASEFESGGNNPFAGMPRNVSAALGCYNMYNRGVSLTSQRVLAMRRRAYDEFVVGQILNDSSARYRR